MKRIARMSLIIILLVSAAFAVKFYGKKSSISPDSTASGVSHGADAADATSLTGKASEYGALADKLAFEDLGIVVLNYWKKPPSLNDEAFLKLEIRDVATNELIDSPGNLSVSVWNSRYSYGIVQPSVASATDKDGNAVAGIYFASGIYFLAPGQWEVRVYLKKKDGTEINQTLNVDLGESPANPMDDPNSPTYIMMKGMKMDHTVNHNRGKEAVEKKKAHQAAFKVPNSTEAPHSESGHSKN